MAIRKQIDWEKIEQDYPELLTYRISNDESGVMRLIKIWLSVNKLEDILQVPTIAHHEFEFSLPKGRVDLILFHLDGSISVVEAKATSDYEKICKAIGQLMFYATQIGFQRPCPPIRKIIIAPAVGKDVQTLLIDSTCRNAGIEFVPMGTMCEQQEPWEDLVITTIEKSGENIEMYLKENAA